MHGHKVELRPPQGRVLRAQSDEACVSLLPPLPPLLTVHLTPALALAVQLWCLSTNGHRHDFLGFRPVTSHGPITCFKVSGKRKGFKSPNIFVIPFLRYELPYRDFCVRLSFRQNLIPDHAYLWPTRLMSICSIQVQMLISTREIFYTTTFWQCSICILALAIASAPHFFGL